eukprot:409513-Prorocentrum_minimum.AAC.2
MFTVARHIRNGACGGAELGNRKGSGGVPEGVLRGSSGALEAIPRIRNGAPQRGSGKERGARQGRQWGFGGDALSWKRYSTTSRGGPEG